MFRILRNIPPIPQIVERWHLLVGAPVYFATLRTACKLNLMGVLKSRPGLTLPEIAAALNIQQYPARVLLLTCTALRLIRKRGDRYYCRLIPRVLFDPASPRSIIPVIEWVHHITYLSMFHYCEAIKECRAAGLEVFEGTEDNMYARIARRPDLEEVFHTMMSQRSRMTNRKLTERIRFSQYPRVLDVGGGAGENLSTIARHHRAVTGTLLDFPTVAERARERFAAEGLQARLEAVGKNFLVEDFPNGYSCVLMAHLTPIFSEATNRELFRKAYQALNPGGLLCINAPFMDDDETGPLESALLSPYFLCTVNGQGRHYSMKETKAWLADAGFTNIEHDELALQDKVLVALKPGA
jgi:cyclopropane fatty-acyl-phospholipid synthase-like methyltransferase